MIDSSFCNVKTPQKKFISSKEVVPINIADKSDKGRFSPSKDMMKLLEGLDRVHLFQFHKEVVLVELTEMPFLSVKVTKDLGEFFRRESPDIPDVIHNLETIAVTDGYYSSFLKYFVAEEFSNPEEYSFSILTVLNYMHAFSISLQDVEVIKEESKLLFKQNLLPVVELDENELILFKSMKRWHKNLHIFDKELINLLDEVNKKGLIDVKEKMAAIPKELKTFLDVKFRKTHVRESFTIHDLFENILGEIMKIYKEKLDDRDSEVEFDTSNIVAGIPPDDVTFYKKVFTPAAVFYTYLDIHKHNFMKVEDLMEDLFSIGAGSKTENLIPEVTAICTECSETLSEIEVENLNLNIFRCQQNTQFTYHVPPSISPEVSHTGDGSESFNFGQDVNGIIQASSVGESTLEGALESLGSYRMVDVPQLASLSEEGEGDGFPRDGDEEAQYDDGLGFRKAANKSIEKESNSEVEFNPFSDVSLICDEKGFRCSECAKLFSRGDFLDYHKKIFHQVKGSIIVEGGKLENSVCESNNSIADGADQSSEMDNLSAGGFTCPKCDKLFSRGDFLSYHKMVFHKEKEVRKTVVPMFVDEGLDLMTTFCRESTPVKAVNVMQKPSAQNEPQFHRGKRSRKILKYPI